MDAQRVDFAIIMTSGPDTPKRLASPFFLAATAAAEEKNVVVYFTGQGTLLLKQGVAEQTYAKAGGRSIKHFMDQALANGAQFVACAASLDLNDIPADQLAYDVPRVSVAQALPYLEISGKIISF